MGAQIGSCYFPKIGDQVEILPAYSMETRARTLRDEWTGRFGVVQEIETRNGFTECLLWIEAGKREVWIAVSRLELLSAMQAALSTEGA